MVAAEAVAVGGRWQASVCGSVGSDGAEEEVGRGDLFWRDSESYCRDLLYLAPNIGLFVCLGFGYTHAAVLYILFQSANLSSGDIL